MSSPLVSVIVPVYKAEKWLHRCIDSILAQTMENFELLLIDDGSPDRSGEICDEYAKKDSRVRVFHKENGGVSSARQKGLEKAIGEYVIHCDPDDWVETDMLMELTYYAKEIQADMVICDFFVEDINGEDLGYYKQNLCAIDTSSNVLAKLINHKIHGSCCNKLVRRHCLIGLSFSPIDLSYAEDELFNIKVLRQNLKVGYLNKAFYHYVQHVNSITSSSYKKYALSRIKEVEELEKVFPIEDHDKLFNIKKAVLEGLFFTNTLKQRKGLFLDIYSQIIGAKMKYDYKLPMQYFFIMALRGYPRLAYYLCKLNLLVISILKKIKNKIL